ncbi:MAG: methyltransferase domain-containing protein [Burkholderiaceae bacterium]
MQNWLKTPPGQYLLDWEKVQLDRVVADVFGYHALQLGLPDLNALQASRMPHRWVASPYLPEEADVFAINNIADKAINTPARVENKDQKSDLKDDQLDGGKIAFFTEFEALPFAENSLDLLILPHSLELSPDPHATLREAERVLMPEGKLIICGFNPLSLWGFKQKRSHLYKRLNFGDLYLPEAGEMIAYRRLRDWLRLLNFDVEPGHFGCYRPAVRSAGLLQRFAWIDKLGGRYWPIFGAVYFVVAVKRVRGMRMISPIKKLNKITNTAPVSVVNKAINTPATVEK